MPTIAILAPSSVPFQIGGAEKFWWGLHKGLSEFSDSYVELLKLPCRELTFAEIVNSYRTFSELDLSHFDMVISTKYPAWMVHHPNHVVYLQHTLRGLYDTYHFTHLPETLAAIPKPLHDLMAVVRKASPTREDLALAFTLLERAQKDKSLLSALFAFPGPLIREVVHFFDRVALAPSQIAAYASISETVRNRKDYFPPDVDVKIIHHPSDIVHFNNAPGEYIFTASRLTNMKRLHLIVEAMRYVTVDIPLRIAGTGPEMERLKALAGDDRRIEFLGYVPDAALPELYSRALFVPFVPYDEDYGLITIEAMRSGKAVVTANDTGGVCEFVFNDKTGYCVEPTPEALGAAMQRLAADPKLARTLGENAQKLVEDITWPNIVDRLLTHAHRSAAQKRSQGRSKVVVVNPFSVVNPVSGGQRRVHALCMELAKTYFVELICMGGNSQGTIQRATVAPCFDEISIPYSEAYIEEEQRLKLLTGASTGDIACMETCAKDTRLLETLRESFADASVVVSSHPYLFPAIQFVLGNKPLIYDAHNVEADMKDVVLSDYTEKSALLEQVVAVEKACCHTASSILTCSKADAERFVSLYDVSNDKMCFVPNGYDAQNIAYTNRVERLFLKKHIGYADVPLALFMGSMHRPNNDAVEHIKKLAVLLPEMHFLIVGSVADAPGIRDEAPENVHFLGVIPEKEKRILLQTVDFGLNPITSGSGTNLKIIEYLASGLEPVSTPFGMRGLEDDACLCAAVRIAEIDDFAATLRQAMQKPLPEALIEAGALRVAEQFAWDRVMGTVAKLVTTILPHATKEGRVCP